MNLPLLAAILLLAPLAAAQGLQTLPSGFETTPGNSPIVTPFAQTARQRWHWVYDSAQFAAQRPIRIMRISVRPPSTATSWGPATYENLTVRVGAARNDYRFHDRSFAEEFVGEPQPFFTGDLTVPAGTHNGSGTAPWSVQFAADSACVYDPAQGRDLIIEVRTPAGASGQNPLLHSIDAQIGSAGVLGGTQYGHFSNADAPCYQFSSVSDFAPIVQIGYEDFREVHANFDISQRTGVEPLTVTFTDRSISGSGAPVSTWAWDFDGDGTVDSTAQNPSFVYSRPGIYPVALTVTDGGSNSSSLTRRDIVFVAARTTNALSAEILDLHFNEVRGTAVANAASSTLAPAECSVRRAGWHADPGRTDFAGPEAGFGCLGIDATAPYENVVDTGWPVELRGSFSLAWWQRMQTAPGNAEAVVLDGGPGLRVFTGGAAGDSIRILAPNSLFLTSTLPVQTDPGSWVHVALIADDTTGRVTWYVNGRAAGFSNLVAGALHVCGGEPLRIGGDGGETSYTRFFELDDVRIYARALDGGSLRSIIDRETTVNTLYDAGCPGAGSLQPRISANSPPTIGNSGYQIRVDAAEPGRPATLMLGFTTHVLGLFPFDLGTFLGAGCKLSPFPDLSAARAVSGAGTAVVALPIPDSLALIGEDAYAQWIVLGSTGAVTRALNLQIRS